MKMSRVSPAESYQVFVEPPREPIRESWAEGSVGSSPAGKTSSVVKHSADNLQEHPVRMTLRPSTRAHDEGHTGSMRTSRLRHSSFAHVVQHNAKDAYIRTGWIDSSAAACIRRFLRSTIVQPASMLCLFVALFLPDVFVALQVPSNTELDVILTLVFVWFVSEFLCLSLTDTTYLLGFFFWMDIAGSISLIFDISYMFGEDATTPERRRVATTAENPVIVRAARAARLGARFGRLSRVLKLLRFLPFLHLEHAEAKVQMARVIQSQLNSVLAKRVALLTILIVVVMPVLNLFRYPEREDSLVAWLHFLAKDVALSAREPASAYLAQSLDAELQRFSDFYKELSYGPFEACRGTLQGSEFACDNNTQLSFRAWFHAPRRRSSVLEVSHNGLQVSYDISTPHVQQACVSIARIVFVICVMLGFGLLMSNSISSAALGPLERMLSVVRQRCKQIFKFAEGMEEDEGPRPVDAEDDIEQEGEFALLERAISKLAAIAHLSAESDEMQMTDSMDEDNLAMLSWQGHFRGSSLLRPSESPKRQGSPQGFFRSTKMSTSSGGISQKVLASLNTDRFNALGWTDQFKAVIAAHVIARSGSCSELVADSHLPNFISAVKGSYLPNPFHNFSHGVDVLCTVARFMRLIEAQDFLSEASQYLLLIAAIGHDAGHIGVNNQFLVETSQELALKYNDRSPLEMMHCATLFQILTRPDCQVLPAGDKALYQMMRKGIITAILHTDMKEHFEMIKELGMVYQLNSEVLDARQPGMVINASEHHVQLALNALLHGADVGNSMKPWELCQAWAHLCLDEFFAQGDRERQAGVPVQPLNDRKQVCRPTSQVGFIEFAIFPLAEAVVRVFPQLDGLVDNLGRNVRMWSDVWLRESSPAQSEIEKVEARVQKVEALCGDILRCTRVSYASRSSSGQASEPGEWAATISG